MCGLKYQRNKKGYSQSHLAKLTNVSTRMIQQYESGERDINKAQVGTIYRLAHVLGCEMSDIIDTDKEDRVMNKIELVERIRDEIERKAMKTGAMGTESVSVTLILTDEEKELFQDIDDFDNKHYWWEIEGSELTFSYTEDVK